mmetsp:Transcript_16531/g.52811  ORF Transcript_16531/g.52811 Transcript_16531/m.52811 type:complete len:358 (-) Transcript_16531:571-1644(-)
MPTASRGAHRLQRERGRQLRHQLAADRVVERRLDLPPKVVVRLVATRRPLAVLLHVRHLRHHCPDGARHRPGVVPAAGTCHVAWDASLGRSPTPREWLRQSKKASRALISPSESPHRPTSLHYRPPLHHRSLYPPLYPRVSRLLSSLVDRASDHPQPRPEQHEAHRQQRERQLRVAHRVGLGRDEVAVPASRRLLLQHAHRPQNRHAHCREVALEDEVCTAVPLVHLAARVEPRRAEVVQVDVERVVVRVLVVREEVLRPPDVRVVHKGQPAKGGRLVDPRCRAQCRMGRFVHGGREEQPLRKRERQRRGQRPRHPPGKAARPDGKGGRDPRPVLGRRLVLCRGAKVAAEQRLEVCF